MHRLGANTFLGLCNRTRPGTFVREFTVILNRTVHELEREFCLRAENIVKDDYEHTNLQPRP